jgi:transposase
MGACLGYVHQTWAFQWIERINEIFHIDKSRREAFFSGRDYQAEDEQLCEQLEAFKEQFDKELCQGSSSPGKSSVLKSLNNHWEGLTVFADQPEVPMDNNGSERALRLSKLIVKNSYGALSNWSVQLTEILLSIFSQTMRYQSLQHFKPVFCYPHKMVFYVTV